MKTNRTRRTFSVLLPVLLAVAGLGLWTGQANAGVVYWDGGDNSWNTAANWSTDAANDIPNPGDVPGAGDSVVFNRSGNNAVAQVVTLDANQSALGLTLSDTGTTTINTGSGTNTLTIGSGGITLASGVGAVTINPTIDLGSSQAWTNNSASDLTVGSITRTGLGTVNFVQASTGIIKTVTANTATSILGGWATFGTGASTTWAVSGGNGSTAGNITGLGTFVTTAGASPVWGSTADVKLDNSNATAINSQTINSLMLSGTSGTPAHTITAANILTITSGGILANGSVAQSIAPVSGTATIIRAGDSTDLFLINTGSGTLTISSVLSNPASGTSNLIKTGSGTVTLSGTNTFGGAGKTITISGGTLKAGGFSDSNFGDPNNSITLDGGTLAWAYGRPRQSWALGLRSSGEFCLRGC